MGTGGKQLIIGLSGAAFAGKSTSAEYLIDQHTYKRVAFAKPIKDMMLAMGLTHEQVYGKLKEVPCALLCGKTPRFAMQTLGTEWRDMIGTELWTNIWRHNIVGINNVVVDDVRFPHEVEAIYALGGVVCRVLRPEGPKTKFSGHASEKGDELPYQYAVMNREGDLDALHKELGRLARSVLR